MVADCIRRASEAQYKRTYQKKKKKEIYLGAAAKQRSRFPSAVQPTKTKEAGGDTYMLIES